MILLITLNYLIHIEFIIHRNFLIDFQWQLSPGDSVMDVRQFLLDAPETCFFTCYDLLLHTKDGSVHQLEDYNEISEVADITAGDCSLEMVAGMLVLCLVSFISDRCNTKVNAFHSHYFPLCIQKWCISYSFFAQYGRKQKEVPNW